METLNGVLLIVATVIVAGLMTVVAMVIFFPCAFVPRHDSHNDRGDDP